MNNWLKTGLIGFLTTAVCCFTPVLVWMLGALGSSAAVVYLDGILLPLLALFIIIAGVGYFRTKYI